MREVTDAGWADGELPLIIEAFESTVLAQLRAEGIAASYVYLIEASGRPYDQVIVHGRQAPTYRETVTPRGLDALTGAVDGISVNKRMLLAKDSSIVADAHARGLQVFTWTARPENAFLAKRFRGSGDRTAYGDYEAEWGALARTGVDGVFVDHPDLGVGFFRP